MAREWSLQETRALVEGHIALKEEETLESRTASEHWNEVAKKLREKGFIRSYKSCNKRWYRLEQYEVQIFSFNMEEGKHKNYWDLTRGERLECREKWPLLPSGDGIDKDMFDLLKKFSHQYEKKEKVEPSKTSTTSVETKEVIHTTPINTDINRQTVPPPPPLILLTPQPTPRTPSYTSGEELQKQQNEESQKKSKHNWSATTAPTEPAPPPPELSSQGALDGFKLQARELRKRRAAEFRKNNRSVPYNGTHATFTKAPPPFLPITPSSANLPPTDPPPTTTATTASIATIATTVTTATIEATTFGSITNSTILDENPMKNLSHKAQTKPPIQFKRLFHSSPKLVDSQNPTHMSYKPSTAEKPLQGAEKPIPSAKQVSASEEKSCSGGFSSFSVQQQQQQPIGSRLNFQNLNEKPLSERKHLLTSINSHLPLLQPREKHLGNSNGNNLGNESSSSKFQRDVFSLKSLDEQLQVILGLQQSCEGQKTTDGQGFGGRNGSSVESQGSSPVSLLSVAIGGLGVQLGAIVKLLQAEHAAEQEFRHKMLQFVECTVKSMRSMAPANED